MNKNKVKIALNQCFCLLVLLVKINNAYNDVVSMSLRMPNVRPMLNDTFLCTAIKMPKDDYYIVEFGPNSSAEVYHGVILGCQTPGYQHQDNPTAVWECGSSNQSQFDRAPECGGREKAAPIFAWKMNASKFTLPQGVGFKVGGDSGINYLVFQVHYFNVDKLIDGQPDKIGVVVSMVSGENNEGMKRAGIFSLNALEHMEVACRLPDPIPIHPFAFLAHTHELGQLVSGYKVTPDGQWIEIGKHKMQKTQMFQPTHNNVTITPDDLIAARCTINNWHDYEIQFGFNVDNEMCVFTMMYYAEGDRLLKQKSCSSLGPPFYFWKTDKSFGPVLEQVDIEASQLK